MIPSGQAAWAPPRRRGLRLSMEPVLLLTAAIIMGVSGGMLWLVGINYDGLTGSAIHKLHPATYLSGLLFAVAMLRAGNPVAYLAGAAARRPASALMTIIGLVYFLHIVLRGAPGMAGALDTFMLPGLVGILLADAEARTLRRLEWVVHAVMLANAGLGLVEFATNQRFFPYRLDGELFGNDTRSTSLQGHPLGNATLTSVYVLALIAGGGSMPPLLRLGMIGLQSAALVTFGGRSGMVVTLVLGGGYGLLLLHRILMAGRIPLLAAAAAVFALPLVPLGIGALAYFGFFDALLQRFSSDGGSANARVEMFALFGKLPLRQLVFGPDTALVESLRRINGLEWGIENPVIRTLLYQGALMTGLLMIGVTLFLVEVARHCRQGIALPMIAFLMLIMTFESLGGKTTLLSKFAILLLALYRPLPERPGARR